MSRACKFEGNLQVADSWQPFYCTMWAAPLPGAAEQVRYRADIGYIRRSLFVMKSLTQLIGVSSATRQVLEDVDCAAGTDAKVLITGESGVGKEVVAQLIHHRSRRSSGKLIAINCAGV